MPDALLASIIITNFNYAAFLRQSIDSALAQTHVPTAVIVVDAGSTDTSGDVIESFGSRIKVRLAANPYLLALPPLLGRIERIDEPQAIYRGHGCNNYWGKSFDQTLAQSIEIYDRQCDAVSEFAARVGWSVDTSGWRKKSWWHQ